MKRWLAGLALAWTASALAAPLAPPAAPQLTVTRGQLRAVVRAGPYCTELSRLGRGAAPNGQAVARPLAPDLCEVLMADFPDRLRGLTGGELAALGLDADAVWPLAEQQTLLALPDPATLDFGATHMAAITDIENLPSLFLNRDRWRAAAAAHGPLIIAMPSERLLIVAIASAVPDLTGFRRATREAFDAAERQVSESVYRWTDAGWVVVR